MRKLGLQGVTLCPKSQDKRRWAASDPGLPLPHPVPLSCPRAHVEVSEVLLRVREWKGARGPSKCSLQTPGEGTSHVIFVPCNVELSDLTRKLAVVNYPSRVAAGMTPEGGRERLFVPRQAACAGGVPAVAPSERQGEGRAWDLQASPAASLVRAFQRGPRNRVVPTPTQCGALDTFLKPL